MPDYPYNGSYYTFTTTAGQYYQIECYGAAGGNYRATEPNTKLREGLGGFSSGIYYSVSAVTLYIYPGEKGKSAQTSKVPTYNGGGGTDSYGGTGGGASHVALRSGLLSSLSAYQSDILIVAGGGGGSGFNWTSTTSLIADASGGDGGGLSGIVGGGGSLASGGGGGTQTAGGSLGSGTGGQPGYFGRGGNATAGGGGGGGFWGGASGQSSGNDSGGGGGSGYINPTKIIGGKTTRLTDPVPSSDGQGLVRITQVQAPSPVTIGANGVITCRAVQYNYKQTKNLIYNGDFELHDDTTYKVLGWTLNEAGGSRGPANMVSYKSLNCLKFNGGTYNPYCNCPMPTPKAGHKYYGGLMWATSSSTFSVSDARFEWFYTDGNNNNMLAFASKSVATNGQWVKLSSIQQAGTAPASGQWQIRNFLVNPSTDSWCDRLMIVDLTEAFGAGNEPTKEWCDANILQWDQYNFGTSYLSASVDVSSSPDQMKATFNGITLIEPSFLRTHAGLSISYDYFMDPGGVNPSLPETNKSSKWAPYLYSGYTYYVMIDFWVGKVGNSYDFYWPVAEPRLGNCLSVDSASYIGGGDLSRMRRLGFYNVRNNWSDESYSYRFDFNNSYTGAPTGMFSNFSIYNIGGRYGILEVLNGDFGLPFYSVSDVNKEWCDRNICGLNLGMIQIKDHQNTQIKFTPMGDIICNDIKIDPSVNKVTFDSSTGTITCKKLIKTLVY